MRNKLVVMLVLAGCCIYLGSARVVKAQDQSQSSPSANSQQSGVDQDIKLMREDIRSKKKQLIAANLKLTDDEATKFWPVYDQYTAELVKINNEKYALIKEYADTWGTMTDAQALSLTNRALDVEKNVANLRIKYVPIFSTAIPGKKVATFYQIERRVQAMIDLQLGSQLPLVQDQQ
jgi:outer membrane murein-binding lipoprotein Lpp